MRIMNVNDFTRKLYLLATIMIGLCNYGAGGETADLVLRNGKIVTMDDARPVAAALAIRGDRIAAVGDEDDVQAFIGERTQVIDLEGKLAVPGFIDGHAHLLNLGESLMEINLNGIRNWDEAIGKVRDAAQQATPGEWILGRGWHQEKWDRSPQPNIDEYPTHDAMSAVSPDNPVMLDHASGHMVFANAKAMQLAGVTSKTRDPSGGEILHDNNGEPIGVFRESAAGLIRSAYDKQRESMTEKAKREETLRKIKLASDDCLSKGVTSFQDAGSSFDTIDLLKELAETNQLALRLWVMIGEGNEALERRVSQYRLDGVGNNHLTVRAIKRFMDGALGAQGAWLLKPYDDLPDSTGLNVSSIESIAETARIAIANGFQLCTHAIGDRANREVLDIYENAFKQNSDKTDLRWRIEHAQHLHPNDIPRFAQLGVIASMQTCHCTSDAPYVVERLGTERARLGAYAWRSLLDTGAKVTNGTDAPVEDVDPIANFYAAVTRRTKKGETFFPEQRMTRHEALRSYTLDAAFGAFEENLKGSLEAGKLADVAVLSQDILTVPEERILDTDVVYTIVGGKIVYQR